VVLVEVEVVLLEEVEDDDVLEDVEELLVVAPKAPGDAANVVPKTAPHNVVSQSRAGANRRSSLPLFS
jgi:hypothetical protein